MKLWWHVSVLALATNAGLAVAQSAAPPATPANSSVTLVSSNESYAEVNDAPMFWGSAEYLLWWIKDSNTPPLVTQSPLMANGTLGQNGTTVLFGGPNIDNQVHSGGRFTAGVWIDNSHTWGAEGSYFFLGSRTNSFSAGGSGAPDSATVGRPFINVNTGREDAELVAQANLLSGTVTVALNSRLQGADLNLIKFLDLSPGVKASAGGESWFWPDNAALDLIAGARYLQLNEGLDIRENLVVAAGVRGTAGSAITVSDRFGTRNEFYGGQMGARSQARFGNLFVNATAKVALGATRESVDIHGATSIHRPLDVTTVAAGGLLALPSNSGNFSRSVFAIVPEVGVTVGYFVTERLQVFAGYNFLYVSDVARPGDQIDRTINPAMLPRGTAAPILVGPSRPVFLFKDTDFWAQGITVGISLQF